MVWLLGYEIEIVFMHDAFCIAITADCLRIYVQVLHVVIALIAALK